MASGIQYIILLVTIPNVPISVEQKNDKSTKQSQNNIAINDDVFEENSDLRKEISYHPRIHKMNFV